MHCCSAAAAAAEAAAASALSLSELPLPEDRPMENPSWMGCSRAFSLSPLFVLLNLYFLFSFLSPSCQYFFFFSHIFTFFDPLSVHCGFLTGLLLND